MTEPTSSTAPNPQAFQQAINYFTQHRYDHKGEKLADDILDTPVVLGIITNPTTQQSLVATLTSNVLFDYIKLTKPLFVRGHNTPYVAGSREQYNVILAFDTQESGEALKELLGISHFETHTFREILEAGVHGDAGICLWNEKSLSILEADRVNEYGRVSLPRHEKTETGNVMDKLSDVSDVHDLRPEEVSELDALLARQDWLTGPTIIGSATYDGIKANLLLVTPNPDLSPEAVIPLVQRLGNAASQIKTPFIVMPAGAKPPVERGGLA